MPFKKVFSIILVIFLSLPISAQNYSHEFGVLTDYEKEMTTYAKDSTAEAVVIYDSGKTNFREIATHFEVIYKRKTKIKVLKESYINKAEYYIPIYDRRGTKLKEKLINIEAYTYNTIGDKITKTILDEDLIYKQKINENYYLLKFAMPNVKVGSIIEMKYELRSPYPILLKDWEFQNTIPTIFSEQVLTMIPFFNYKIMLQGASKFDEKNIYEDSQLKEYENLTYRDKIYHFVMKDIPAFKSEAFISSQKAYIIKLDFQLAQYHEYRGSVIEILSTWEELIKDLLVSNDNFGEYIKKSKYNFKKIIGDNNLLIKSEKEKTDFIINNIKQNYNWNGWNNIETTRTLKTFLKGKTGNNAQLNLYLIGALKAAEIEVYPVIISTRGNGKIIRQYPFLDPFNYVIAYAKVEGKWLLLDATDTYCPNDKIPKKCINDIGLIINKEEVKWLKITRHDLALTQNNFKSKVSNNLDTLIGSVNNQSNGYSALDFRKGYENNTDELEEYFNSDNIEITSPLKTKNYIWFANIFIIFSF